MIPTDLAAQSSPIRWTIRHVDLPTPSIPSLRKAKQPNRFLPRTIPAVRVSLKTREARDLLGQCIFRQ